MLMQFKSNTIYTAYHNPTGEDWVILGIDEKGNRVCAAGWPPTIAKLTDCTDFKEERPLTDEERQYRAKNFGYNWL